VSSGELKVDEDRAAARALIQSLDIAEVPDDRAVVERLGDVVRSPANQLHAPLARLAVWIGPGERR